MQTGNRRPGDVPYDAFASFYNRHLGQFAQRILPVLDDLILSRLPPRASVLDLCCGTGQLASLLQGRGCSVLGVDESAEMIRVARRNAPGARFIQADAGDFQLPERVDGAVCTFDSVNHVLSIDSLEAVFSCVYRHLKNDGCFVFDANMEAGYLTRWGGRWQGRFEEDLYDISAKYDREQRIGRNQIRVNGSTGGVKRQWEIRERCYTEQELRDALQKAGFTLTGIHDGHKDLGLFGEWGRGFFVCRKAPKAARQRIATVGRQLRTPKYRSVATCRDDAVCPGPALRRELGGKSRRLQAVQEVLCRLEPCAYGRLLSQAGCYSWFIPSADVLGQVHPFPAHRPSSSSTDRLLHARVVYLSPLLEQQPWAIVVTAVAHELIHVILEHEIFDPDADTYRRQEREVAQKLTEWGFKDDVAAAQLALHREGPTPVSRDPSFTG